LNLESVRKPDTATLYRVYLGRAELGGAMRARKLTLSGPRVLQRAFGRWFAWSAFAAANHEADERGREASRLAAPGGCASNCRRILARRASGTVSPQAIHSSFVSSKMKSLLQTSFASEIRRELMPG
jgi:hypothetical protein